MTYSNDPQPSVYAKIPSPLPNIDFPAPFWINKLANMAIIGCLNPDLVFAEMAVAAAAKMMWTVETPSTKQLVQEATGHSWICGSKQVLSGVQEGEKIADSGTGRFLYGAAKGVDIMAYYAFMLSTGAKGVVDFGSFASKFIRKCSGTQSPYRGLDPIGGWPVPLTDWDTGPTFLNAGGGVVGQRLTIEIGQIGVMIAWCSFSILAGSGGVVVTMGIVDEDTGAVYDQCVVNNMFNTSQYAIVQYFTSGGRAGRRTILDLKIKCTEHLGDRMVPVNGGCYVRAWSPDAGDAPPYWNMRDMLKSKGLTA